jgi:acyl transferase domain-containing protein
MNGAMMAVPLSEADALSYIERLASKQPKGKISVGCVNSPKSVTITGDADQVDALKALLDEASISARKLQVNVAYHSSHMNTIADKYANSIQDLCSDDFLESATMVSSVTREIVPVQELSKSAYWVQNLISPVRFSEALSQICQAGKNQKGRNNENSFIVNDLLEIGPHSTLQGPTKDILKSIPGGEKITYASILTRFASASNTVPQAIGQMHCLGYKINFGLINGVGHKSSKFLPDLPEYSFDHTQLYWHETAVSSTGFRLRPHGKLDLLGTTAADWNPLEARWKNSLNITQTPWVQDHKVCI